MLANEEVELIKREMLVSPAELPILEAIAKLRLNLDEVRDGILLVRRFNHWHLRHGHPYPLLSEFKSQMAENQWFAILWWWDEFCDARKKISDPTPDDLFICFRNYKPDR